MISILLNKALILSLFINLNPYGAKDLNTNVESFYLGYQLSADSASHPFLFYKAYDWMYTKYRYAGGSKKGIDCSGFVSEMYKQVFCIQLSGGSKDIFKTVQPINKTDLKEGDLVFFKINHGRISHVGIYLGNDKFVHATVKSGVIVSDLKEPYYKKYYYNGGRINVNLFKE